MLVRAFTIKRSSRRSGPLTQQLQHQVQPHNTQIAPLSEVEVNKLMHNFTNKVGQGGKFEAWQAQASHDHPSINCKDLHMTPQGKSSWNQSSTKPPGNEMHVQTVDFRPVRWCSLRQGWELRTQPGQRLPLVDHISLRSYIGALALEMWYTDVISRQPGFIILYFPRLSNSIRHYKT